MANGPKLCMSCMKAVPAGATECPNCGYNGTQRNPDPCLPIGFRLAGRYVVGHKLDSDSGSVSYVAFDMSRHCTVELREFLPQDGCVRSDDGTLHPKQGAELHYKTALVDFCDLYRTLASLNGVDSLLRTLEFFEAGGTAYAVLEHFDGALTLRELLSKSGGVLTFDRCFKLLSPVFDALEAMHNANLIHRGVSPDTIFINLNGDVKLGGFATSAVRTKDGDAATKMQSGFSAPEQYSATSWQDAQTDVYGLAATFYRCLTGTTPQDAEQRRSYDTLESAISLNSSVPQYVSRTLSLAMLVNMKERISSIDELRRRLSGEEIASEDTRIIDTEEVRSANAAEKPSKAGKKQKPEKLKKTPQKDSRRSKSRPADVDDDADDDEPPRANVKSIAIVAAVVLVVLIAMFFVGKKVLAAFEKPEDDGTQISLTAPDYVNKKISEIVFDRENFSYKYEYVTDNTVEENTVVRQSPEPGTEVDSGAEITLYISQADKNIKMIKVIGYSQSNAETMLKEAGIKYEIQTEQTGIWENGTVFRQSINEGVMISADTVVTITVAAS